MYTRRKLTTAAHPLCSNSGCKMTGYWQILIILLPLLFQNSASTGVARTIYVDGKRGNDSECARQEVASAPCRSLVMAGQLLQQYGGRALVLIQSNLTLKDKVHVFNITSFDIVGSHLSHYNLTYIRCEAGEAGFVLNNVHDFRILNLALYNCQIAMMIESFSNFILNNMLFENCYATALVMINNTECCKMHLLLKTIRPTSGKKPM